MSAINGAVKIRGFEARSVAGETRRRPLPFAGD
jgi:hypothetical protein